MLKRRKVYICDFCGAVALEQTYASFGDTWKGPPENWTALGSEDLCPICAETYRRFREEVESANGKVHKIGFAPQKDMKGEN